VRFQGALDACRIDVELGHGAHPPRPGRSPEACRAVKRAPQQALARGFVLQGFDRATDERRVELHLRPVPIDRLRSVFDAGDDLEMYDAYPLDAGQAGVLAPLVSEPIDTEKYDFVLQRYA
jgi:hypothetical protein